MNIDRRTVLIGLGTLTVGGGAAIGTGAFSSVEASRTVTIETTGDGAALLGLAPADRPDHTADPATDGNAFVDEPDDGTIEINLDGTADAEGEGLAQNAVTGFRNLVTITNNGTQIVDELRLEFTETAGDVTAPETFAFFVDQVDSDGDGQDRVVDNADILTGENGIPGSLAPGEAINFGIDVDLKNGGDPVGELPEDGEYTVTIEATVE